jgi:hypothetical protein
MGIHEFGTRPRITAQPLPGIVHQGVNVNVFDRLPMTSMLPVHATPPRGLAYRYPVRGPIASATKARRIHQGF